MNKAKSSVLRIQSLKDGKINLNATECKVGRAPEPIWWLWRKDKSLVLAAIELIFFGRPASPHTAEAIPAAAVGIISRSVVQGNFSVS
jgi:hypothetical protein